MPPVCRTETQKFPDRVALSLRGVGLPAWPPGLPLPDSPVYRAVVLTVISTLSLTRNNKVLGFFTPHFTYGTVNVATA